MGSQSDWETMQLGAQVLEKLGIPHEVRIISAHRTPDRLFEYAKSARERGLHVIIAGAGIYLFIFYFYFPPPCVESVNARKVRNSVGGTHVLHRVPD
jgi:hypothetical protein